jgi:hypothetical protein
MGGINNSYMEFKFLLGVKVIYLIDRTDLFRITNLVWWRKQFLQVCIAA